MKSFYRILSLILVVVLALSLVASALIIIANAATTLSLKTLLEEGKIKPLGRTQVNVAGTGITTDWSGTGFEININATGGAFTVGYKGSYGSYWVILVDGQEIWRGLAPSGTGTFGTTVPAGKHTVSVIKETQISSSTTAYWDLTSLTFDGTVETAPANNGLYMEFIGDSYSCGDGALGEYQAGIAWIGAHDSATHGFPWYTAKAMGADYSIVARGGIGLFDGKSAQESTVNKVTMADIYSYTSGYRSGEGSYGFSRKPDVIIVELGANDGIVNSDPYKSLDSWTEKLNAFIDQVRSRNGSAPKIVMLSHDAAKYNVMRKLVLERESTDPNLFAFHFSHNGHGSAARADQKEGHPDYNDHQALAKALVNFIQTNDVLPTYETAPTYKDYAYYVSSTGNNSNAGTAAAPKATLSGALTAAKNARTYAAGDRIVVKVSGAVVGSDGQLFGGVSAIRNSAGQRVPILVTTDGYTGSNAAELKITFKPTASGACAIYPDNDFYFKDITIKSYSNGNFCVNSFYSATSNITFDNVTLTTDKQSSYMTWIVSTGNFANGAGILDAVSKETHSSITFLNGNYTDVYRASVTRDHVWTSSGNYNSLPYYHGKLVIGKGATVKDVYGLYGSLEVGSATVEIRGGTVTNFSPTNSGTADAYKNYTGNLTTVLDHATIANTAYRGTGNYVNLKGNVTTVIDGGNYSFDTFYGTGTNVNVTGKVSANYRAGTLTTRQYCGAGSNVTINGNVENNISGGQIQVKPTHTNQGDGFYLGGYDNTTVNGSVINNISGGDLNLIYDVASIDSGIYLGTRSNGKITGDLINNISGGNLCTLKGTGSITTNGIYLGMYSGNIYGTLKNNISAGTLDVSNTGGGINFGDRTVNNFIGKIENTLGAAGSSQGPRFFGGAVSLGGGWAQLGVSAVDRSVPEVSACTDTVVMTNTIYDAYFNSAVHAGVGGRINTSKGYYSYCIGSVQNTIYGGKFVGGFYGSSDAEVYGHVKTDIYGGFFTSLYAASSGTVYDGVELNIYAMEEYYPTSPTNAWGIYAGGTTGAIHVQTPGRAAAALTVAPEKPEDLTLNTPLYASCSSTGTINGDVTVQVSGGTFPNGFAVSGKTVGEILAPNRAIYDITTGKEVAYSAADTSVAGIVAVCPIGESYTRELVYYVSENGQDAYNGTSAATPKKTLNAVFTQLYSDSGTYNLPAGTKVTIYVEGTVLTNVNDSQVLGGANIFYTGKSSVHIPFTIATYNYNGSNPATIVCNQKAINGGNATMYVVNDLNFKNINIKAVTNPDTGYCTARLFAAGCSISFDNTKLINDGKATKGSTKWSVYADHFSRGGFNPLNTAFLPHYGTLTFKNGDYTNLATVSPVGSNTIYVDGTNDVSAVDQMFCKLIIEDGAKMGTVYGLYGTLAVGSATVEIRGGTVEKYIGTNSGTSASRLTYKTNLSTTVSGGAVNSWEGSGSYINFTGNITNTVSGGKIGGNMFTGLCSQVTLTGNLTNNISGGKIEVNPTSTENGGHGIFLSGLDNVNITGNVENNVSGGDLGVVFQVTNLQSGIWFGLRNNGKIAGNLTNNISGGSLYTRAESSAIAPRYASFHLGVFSGGVITGTLTNRVTGGTFEITNGAYYFGQQGIAGSTAKIVNILGVQSTGEGPTFTGTKEVLLGGNFGRIGVTSNISTLPAVTDCTDTVVISNTIYGGNFGGNVVCSPAAGATEYVTYVKGSVKTDVYGGNYNAFFGTGNSPVYGKVTTNIHGGTFNGIYGARAGNVYDGVELNIYSMTEGANPNTICAGPGSGTVSARTSGRDAVKLTIDPTEDLVLSLSLSVQPYSGGSITGTTSALVTGGTYTKGFGVSGKTVKEVLAAGLLCRDKDGKLITLTDTTTNTGTYTVLTNGKVDLSSDGAVLSLSGVDTPVIYDGSEKKPTVKVTLGSVTLTENTDYSVSYQRNGSATDDLASMGKVTVLVTGKGNYTGSISASYEIVRNPAITAAITELIQKIGAYDVNTVTSADKADIQDLRNKLFQLQELALTQLTEDEKAQLISMISQCNALLSRIQTVEETLSQVKELLTGKTEETVTTDHETDLQEAKSLLEQVLAGNNLTAEERIQAENDLQLCKNLLVIISETTQKRQQVQNALQDLTADTITTGQKALVEETKTTISQLLAGKHLTDQQRSEMQTLSNKCDALLAALAELEAQIAAAEAKLSGITTDNVTSDNTAALEAALEAVQALSKESDRLSQAQKDRLSAVSTNAQALLDRVSQVSGLFDQANEKLDGVTLENVTAEDVPAIEEAIDLLEQGLATNNLTEQERTSFQNGITQCQKALDIVQQVAQQVEDAEASVANYDTSNVGSDDLAAIEEAKAAAQQLLSSPHLTEEQISRVEAVVAKCNSLTSAINGIPGDIDHDGEVNKDDLTLLLLHVTMSDEFPITADADFNHDGKVTKDDLVLLLLHVTMSDEFPLT